MHELRKKFPERLEIESLDITKPDDVSGLHSRLQGRMQDVMFVNAGAKNDDQETIGQVATDEFMRVMSTNALSPLRVIETFSDLVQPKGTIAVMSSGLGSVGNNESGGYEVYRASKAALNTLMRSFAARTKSDNRTLARGWVRTDMGGPQASLSNDESIPNLVNTIEAHQGQAGLHYVDYMDRTVPW